MTSTPLVDVVLPTFRRPHTVEYSIRSVLSQTVADLRLHVVGDGCSEETEEVVREIGDPRVSFHRFPKARGFGYANRNVVLRGTRAPFVAYVTDDDLWFPDHLELALAELRARRLALVAFRSCHVKFPDRLDARFFAFDWRVPVLSGFLRNWFMGSVTCVHERRVFDTVGYWDDRLFRFGDRDFYNRVRTSSEPTLYVDKPTVLRFYAQHWDGLYERAGGPPQRRYLALLGDPAWRGELRRAAAGGPAPFSTRLRQLGDFTAFGVKSGPKFARFLWERAGRRAGGSLHAARG
jgi:glycosyltransferase involved in cell wall biosynthesis